MSKSLNSMPGPQLVPYKVGALLSCGTPHSVRERKLQPRVYAHPKIWGMAVYYTWQEAN